MVLDSKIYDNRNTLKTMRLRLIRKCKHHFSFNYSGKKIVYCYIRKNACSAFKRLLVDISGEHEKPSTSENPIDFISNKYRCFYPQDIHGANHIIFIYRDPIERIISLFINKFVHQEFNLGIFRSYMQVTGCDPHSATFRDFIYLYLDNDLISLDPHVLPQYLHLLPIRYTDAIPLGSLYDSMSEILGQRAADHYFSRKVNSSASKTIDCYQEKVVEVPANEIRDIWLSTGNMPSIQSFVDEQGELASRLNWIYRIDKEFRK